MTTDAISPDLKTILRRLKLSRMLDTLPERFVLARQQKMPHQDLLLLVLSDEATRRDSLAVALRVQRARLDPAMHWDGWDPTAQVTFDRAQGSALREQDAERCGCCSRPTTTARRALPVPANSPTRWASSSRTCRTHDTRRMTPTVRRRLAALVTPSRTTKT